MSPFFYYFFYFFFFFNDTATTEIYTLSLHDALPSQEPYAPAPAHPPDVETQPAFRWSIRFQARAQPHRCNNGSRTRKKVTANRNFREGSLPCRFPEWLHSAQSQAPDRTSQILSESQDLPRDIIEPRATFLKIERTDVVPANYKHASLTVRRACGVLLLMQLRGTWHRCSPR